MIKTNALSVNKIKEVASLFRTLYNVANDEPFPVLEVIDNLFVKKQLSYQIVEDSSVLLPDNAVAIYNPAENFIYIKESVIEEYETGVYRSSFTLCHELFHYIQTQILGFSFEEVKKCPSFEDVDWQANEFAAQVLIPSEYLDLDSEELANKFHVSLECVLTRKTYAKRRKKSA